MTNLYLSNLAILFAVTVIVSYSRMLYRRGSSVPSAERVLVLGIILSWLTHTEARVFFSPHFYLSYVGRSDLIPYVISFYQQYHIDTLVLDGSFLIMVIAAIMHRYTSLTGNRGRRLAGEVVCFCALAAIPLFVWL